MAAPKLTRAEFDALLRHAGLAFAEPQKQELYGAWGTLEALIARLKTPELPPEVEPATIIVMDEPR
jgi:hypothetical protein